MGEGVASYAAHLGSTRRRCRSAWTPRGGPLGGEGLDPSPLPCRGATVVPVVLCLRRRARHRVHETPDRVQEVLVRYRHRLCVGQVTEARSQSQTQGLGTEPGTQRRQG